MNTITISQYRRTAGEKFHDKVLIIDSHLSLKRQDNHEFIGCTFKFEKNGSIEFNECVVQFCKFEGMSNLHDLATNKGLLFINDCKHFDNNSFSGQFRRIIIERSDLKNFSDQSITTFYSIQSTEITDFKIGGECEDLYTNIVRFRSQEQRSSNWNKKIDKSAVCTSTIFDNIKLNPFYLATKCKDKSSLDIARATLIDHWSRLRKKYAGLSLFIVFFLTFFIFPAIVYSRILFSLSFPN